MSSRTPTQEKALRWYVERNKLRPQLSAHPVYYFQDRAGKETKCNIQHIVNNYKKAMERETRGLKGT